MNRHVWLTKQRRTPFTITDLCFIPSSGAGGVLSENQKNSTT